MDIIGVWHIYEMELWDEDYFNMEVQAYIRIDENNQGDFQFGLVTGDFKGRVVQRNSGERFEFRWIGTDELDPIDGIGWIKVADSNLLLGEFTFNNGEQSKFKARRI